MTVRASAALFLMTGLLVGIAAPMPATAAGEDDAAVSKHESSGSATGSRPAKPHASRKSSPTATKSEASKKDDSRKAGDNQTADAAANPPAAVPPSLANANAQMVTDAPSDSARGLSAAMSNKANNVLQAASDKPADAEAPAESGVVASDQLNDFDRGLQAAPIEQPVTQTVAIATVKPTLASTSQAASNDSSTLDKTSLIGKIFIAFGALLTVASAARMFMA